MEIDDISFILFKFKFYIVNVTGDKGKGESEGVCHMLLFICSETCNGRGPACVNGPVPVFSSMDY